ncbi:fibronectin type III domain-containing protein [Chryseolinea soli]|uniref:Fibronectin type III domain-containing protein n=1 Tax=Chryseolinea soli TaxID=2321403 RepID=A0A385SPP8_9BACT|nr:fibronectin type III domain-containing protein [Chryseolinea soli]AYB31935.1 fibronectin type III domain-containing protein [Chryseolinea soli]
MNTYILKTHFFLTALVVVIGGCQEDPHYDPNRPSTPTGLEVTKGDTSVFLSWTAVGDASSYVVVRGLQLIADSLTSPSFVDDFAPDTLTEYRVYAVSRDGWRSYRYASDSGYSAVPSGILPRPPVISASDGSNYKNCTITWSGGRFATSFNIYRDGSLIAEKFVGTSYTDNQAPVTPVEYRVYAVNDNGASTTFASDMGNKGYFFIDTFENDVDGYVINPWTFRVDPAAGYGVAYYTEGSPVVVSGEGYEGSSKALKIVNGKAQLLCDWGGAPVAGKYKITLKVKKANGGFWMVPNFSGAERVNATSDWTSFEIETALITAGSTFNIKVEPDQDGDPAFFDDWAIEYIAP